MKHLLMSAKAEIEQLRRENELLRGKVHVVDVFAAVLFGAPRQMGATIDIAWELQREIDKFGDVHPIKGESGQVG